MSNIKLQFEPYIGTQYGKDGNSILVVGEFHPQMDYSPNDQVSSPPLTQIRIRSICDSYGEAYLFRYIAFLLAPSDNMEYYLNSIPDGYKYIFDKIAYYSYIQKPIPFEKDWLPHNTKKNFYDPLVIDAFFDVLVTKKPKKVLAMGGDLYNNLPSNKEIQDKNISRKDIDKGSIEYSLIDGSQIPILCVPFPKNYDESITYRRLVQNFIK